MASARAPIEDPGPPERAPGRRPLAEAERARAVLALGILALRWAALALMLLMAVITGDLRRPLLAGIAIALATAWTVWLTIARPRGTALVLAADLAIAAAAAETMGAREQAARLSERESLARQIHDSVLQSLAMVHKRARELAGVESVPAAEVARLASATSRS
jgi:signal transduction histidine kinase